MNILKKAGIGIAVFFAVIYLLFLIVPFFLNGILNSYSDEISKIVEEQSGFKLKLEKLQILTTPKLTAGLKAGHIDLMLPSDDSVLSVDNAQGKISLLPFLWKRIEIDTVSAENINLNLKVQKDGKFLLENYIPEPKEQEVSEPITSLPMGLKLSDKLPDITVKNYGITFTDMPTDKKYIISGDSIKVRDFVFNKKIKAAISGKAVLDNKEQFSYDIKLFNKIMPAMQLNDLVFTAVQDDMSEATDTAQQNDFRVNPIDIFKAIYNNQLTADLAAKVKTSGTLEDINAQGYLTIDNMGLAVDGKKLPDSNLAMEFKGNSIKLNSKLYSSENELTQINGDFKTGKRPHIDLTCKSNANFLSLIDMIDSIAKSFGYHDLDTLKASGGIDADFNINSNLKKIESSGYLRIPDASLNYGLYNVAVDNINADIDLNNNAVNIKNAGLTVASQPLKINGIIDNKANADIHILADKLQLKGLIAAAGQMALLKDNTFKSGTVSMDTSIKGRLDKILPKVNVTVDNINILNKPSSTSVLLSSAKVDIETDGKNMSGKINAENFKVINPMASLSAPQSQITLGDKDIVIDKAYLLFNNSRVDITGKIADYMTKKINFDIKANGNILGNDIKAMFPAELRKDIKAAGSMPLTVTITGNDKAQHIDASLKATPSGYVSILDVDQLRGKTTQISTCIKIANDSLKFADTAVSANGVNLLALNGSVNSLSKSQKLNLQINTPSQIAFAIPGFKNSKIKAKGDISVSGNALNPILKGNIDIPSIAIPDMDLLINNMAVALNGPILVGKGTAEKFKSGGIIAENLSANFNLKDNVFYLRAITGDAFSGKVNGSVSYNILNGKIGVDFKGSGMEAVKAIEGAAGIKNAMSGKLGFSANVSLSGATEAEMMKSLKGKVTFNIDDGEFANIGRFENFLYAGNIASYAAVKAVVTPLTNLPVVKNTAKFKNISGTLSFNSGWAQLNPVKMSGPSMSYYITGKYNLLNGTANLVILGRLSAEVVKALGPLGDMSVDKLTSYIPKFGALTGNLINAFTTNPKGENIAAIPALSSGNKNYKDFKVVFNGGLESKSSVKSFKWLSQCDTSQIEGATLKEQLETTKKTLEEKKEQVKTDFKNSLEESRKRAEESRKQLEDAKNNLNNLKDLFKN